MKQKRTVFKSNEERKEAFDNNKNPASRVKLSRQTQSASEKECAHGVCSVSWKPDSGSKSR